MTKPVSDNLAAAAAAIPGTVAAAVWLGTGQTPPAAALWSTLHVNTTRRHSCIVWPCDGGPGPINANDVRVTRSL